MAVDATQHAAAAASHAAESIPELPNAITFLSARWHDSPWIAWLHYWENLVFALVVGLLLGIVAWRHSRRPATIPHGWQNILELFVESVDQFVQSILGKDGRHFTPFIGTLFLYIWLMNLAGMVPGMKSATGNLNTTAALALVVFGYVQWTGMRRLGLIGYVDHLAGQPRDLFGWFLVPLMLPIHLLGEFIKPISLSMRLCFNIFAEDILLAVVVGLGIGLSMGIHLPPWLPLPLQLLIIPLMLIFSTVQALVFSLLSTVYIGLMLPHEEHR